MLIGHLMRCVQWGAKALRNMLIVPPGSGIVHQVNLEYLARVVFNTDGYLYPDSLVGTDSHTTMINGLGIVGWGELLIARPHDKVVSSYDVVLLKVTLTISVISIILHDTVRKRL